MHIFIEYVVKKLEDKNRVLINQKLSKQSPIAELMLLMENKFIRK